MSNVSAKVLLESPSTIIQLREGDRSVAQVKLSKSDHLSVIEGLLTAVVRDEVTVEDIMKVIRDEAHSDYQ